MEYSVSYEVLAEDYIDLQLTYNRNSDTVKKNIRNSRINLASFFTFLVLVLYHPINGIARYLVLGMLILLGIVSIVMVEKIFEFRIRRASRKVLSKMKSENESDKKRLSVHEDEIEYIEKKRNTKFKISNIVKILESNKNIFIFWDESNAVILPKIYNNNTEESRRILEYIKSKMEKKEKQN